MRRALVTGGAGFIGSALVRRLLDEGVAVRVLDDLSSGRRENLAGLEGRLRFHRGDVREVGVVTDATRGVDAVFHLAAVASVQRSLLDPLGTHAVNVGGTLAVLEAARASGVPRVILACSAAAYGTNPVLPLSEDEPAAPISPYGLHKHMCEQLGALYTAERGLDVVALRFFNVYGPRQDPAGEYAAVVPKFIEAMAAGGAPTIYGDGTQTRDFCFVDDVARALRMAVDAVAAPGRVVNIGAGSETSLLDLVAAINQALGAGIAPRFAPPRAGDIHRSCADVSRARALLGFTAAVGLEEGLGRALAHWTGVGG
ncbi:MAG: NAD-dependent epimerase/dehydratase family protein [Pseudomonadota bacterium]